MRNIRTFKGRSNGQNTKIYLSKYFLAQNQRNIEGSLVIEPLHMRKIYQSLYVFVCHVKQHLKIVSGIIISCSTTLNIKMIRNYQKNFGKSKSAMEHQKLHGKLSEYVPLTTQTVSAAFTLK